MHGRVIRIERISPRSGAIVTAKGYQLADPAHGKHNTTPNTRFTSLDEAAAFVERGFSLRMGAKGKPPSLIAPKSLRIVREGERPRPPFIPRRVDLSRCPFRPELTPVAMIEEPETRQFRPGLRSFSIAGRP